jgi:Tol biopolymer transport system component
MSPEQAEGKSVDARSDIFSFGSVFHEMLTGQKAFRGDSRLSTMASILREEPVPVSRLVAEIPRDVERVIQRCMRKDPARRFQHMDDLKVALEELRDESASGASVAASGLGKKRRSRWPWAAALAVSLLAAGGWATLKRGRTAVPPMTVIPFTTYAGAEQTPSFSPDGNNIAFSWSGDKDDNADIYVRLIGAGSPLRLTTNADEETMPAWSPDSRWIAFVRMHRYAAPPGNDRDSASLFLIPALGGVERRLTGLPAAAIHFPAVSWSADSKWIAIPDSGVEDRHGLSLYEIDTGQRRPLTSPPAGQRHRTPAFSPDGRKIVFSQSSLDTLSDIYLLDLTSDYKPSGPPKRLTNQTGWIQSAAWMPDGNSIVYSSGQWGNISLWRTSVSGSQPPERLQFGEDGTHPAISRDGRRLAYTRSTHDLNIWRVDLNSRSAQPPQPRTLITSTRMDHTPAYSPDGRRIAFSSNRSGTWEIWVSDAGSSNTAQLTSFGGPFTRFPSWSPDGRRIVFDSRPEGHADIFVINADGGRPDRLTDSPAMDIAPTWSRDGKWIYFNSNRSGRGEIWRMSVSDPKNLTRITTGSAYSRPLESVDGKYLYYAREGNIWRVGPLDSAAPPEVQVAIPGPPPGAFEFGVGRDGLFYFQRPQQDVNLILSFFDFKTARSSTITRIPRPIHMGITLSPDEKSILYTQIDQYTSDLMLVENFR